MAPWYLGFAVLKLFWAFPVLVGGGRILRDFHLPSFEPRNWASVPACPDFSRSFDSSRVQAGMHFEKVEAIRR
jgi:hypothetical protein